MQASEFSFEAPGIDLQGIATADEDLLLFGNVEDGDANRVHVQRRSPAGELRWQVTVSGLDMMASSIAVHRQPGRIAIGGFFTDVWPQDAAVLVLTP